MRASALVTGASPVVVARDETVVSPTSNPSFILFFDEALEEGTSYEVHYWIDSNFGGGTAGVCDPKGIDHQWRIVVAPVNDPVALNESHIPGETEDVCDSFAG